MAEGVGGSRTRDARIIARRSHQTENWNPAGRARFSVSPNQEAQRDNLPDQQSTPFPARVEDQLDALDWAKSIGGLPRLIDKSRTNLDALANGWNKPNDILPCGIHHYPIKQRSICLKTRDHWFTDQNEEAQRTANKGTRRLLEMNQLPMTLRDIVMRLPVTHRGGGTVEVF